MKTSSVLIAFCLCVASSARADAPKCPDPIKTGVAKVYPDAVMTSCKHEREDGREQYEVVVVRKDKTTVEIDVGLDGKILQTEEKVDLKDVPDAVMKAFAAKYPKGKATKAERQVRADGGTYYEIGFRNEKGKKAEATFSAAGAFVEEE